MSSAHGMSFNEILRHAQFLESVGTNLSMMKDGGCCAIHNAYEDYGGGGGCGEYPLGTHHAVRAAHSGKFSVCMVDGGQRFLDEALKRQVIGIDKAFLRRCYNGISKKYCGGFAVSSSVYGRGYCYLEALVVGGRSRAARALGPLPRLSDFARYLFPFGDRYLNGLKLEYVTGDYYHVTRVAKDSESFFSFFRKVMSVLEVNPRAKVGLSGKLNGSNVLFPVGSINQCFDFSHVGEIGLNSVRLECVLNGKHDVKTVVHEERTGFFLGFYDNCGTVGCSYGPSNMGCLFNLGAYIEDHVRGGYNAGRHFCLVNPCFDRQFLFHDEYIKFLLSVKMAPMDLWSDTIKSTRVSKHGMLTKIPGCSYLNLFAPGTAERSLKIFGSNPSTYKVLEYLLGPSARWNVGTSMWFEAVPLRGNSGCPHVSAAKIETGPRGYHMVALVSMLIDNVRVGATTILD